MQSVEKILADKMVSATTTGFQYRTPANIQDFAGNPDKQKLMNSLWNNNLDGFTQQGMLNNNWNSTNTPPTTNYYNPIYNNPASNAANILWMAFPGRLEYNFPSATPDQLYQMADTGVMPGQISNDPCDIPAGQNVAYFPYGPRGWQDEYCEWAVTRNEAGKITRIDFTCENPEYWNTLWEVDPNQVLSLYQSILDKPQITLQDLSVPGIVNPITNQPVYNPLNKWNSGPVSSSTQGGAIHLTSTPNTIQTEIGLATTSTVQRFNPPPPPATTNTMWQSSQYNDLICVGQFGQRFRNSDPNIGGTVNHFVTQGLVLTLADPPGLYIQMPDFSNYKTPDGTDASTFWTIKRGSKTLKDQNGVDLPGNFILHAVFEVPASKNYTVSDITISGEPIKWGSQVTYTFKMQIVASAYPGTVPQGYEPVGDTAPNDTYAQPLQMFYQDYFDTLYNISVPNPVNNPIPLLSNSTYVPSVVNVGSTAKMVVVVDTCTAEANKPDTYPKVSFGDANITAEVTAVKENVFYAVPGNSQPGTYKALYITVHVGANARHGQQAVYVTNVGQQRSAPMLALFTVSPVIVQSTIAWQNTGIILTPTQKATVKYVSGLWTANPADNGGQLYNAGGNPVFFQAPPGYPMAGQNIGALVGRVGSTVFMIGMGAEVPANLSGELQLVINDDLNAQYGAGLTDNIGFVTVTIDVS